MYDKIVLILLIVSLSYEKVEGRKLKRTQQPKESDNPAPQPNVLTYSTFGFNDVGSHDGFIETSPDNANYLTKYRETSEKLYAPAFPSAMDSDFSSNSQSLNGEVTGGGDGATTTSMSQFNSVNNYGPNFNSDNNLNKNSASDVDYSLNLAENNRPVYGSKISTANRNMSSNWYKDTEPNNGISYQNKHKFSSYRESPLFSGHLTSYSESNDNNQFIQNYATTYPTTEIENSMNAESLNTHNLSKFPNIGDFTNTKSYDTFELENKYSLATSKPLETFNSMVNNVGDDRLNNYYEDHSNKLIKISPSFKNTFENKGIENIISSNQNVNTNQEYLSKHSNVKNYFKNKKLNNEYKDEQKTNPWILENGNNYVNKRIKNHRNGYEYATNFSSASFKFDDNEPKKQYNSNIDEIIPSSSNINDFTNYKFPETEYLNFKANPSFRNTFNNDNSGELSYIIGNKYNPSPDYLNKFKNVHSNVPTSITNWGNVFKSTDYSSYKKHIPKAQFNDEENFDIVHIPNGQNNYRHGKDSSDGIANDWPIYNNKPSILQRPKNEWSKESFNNRFKSEEDLLGLRNHDTSHPTYLPSFQYPVTDNPEESFKTTVEKWRENYIKSKYHDTPTYDYEASEAKYFQPSNPYQVPVPVVKPYPVPVPQVRPVFHHSRPYRDEFDLDQDFDDGEEYLPRPESSKVVYNKRPKSPRHRSRRPSRMSQQERSKGRRPQRGPNGSREKDDHRYVQSPLTDYQHFRNHDGDFDAEREHREYLLYCKRTDDEIEEELHRLFGLDDPEIRVSEDELEPESENISNLDVINILNEWIQLLLNYVQ
ncbi:unnamed protein product [Parnassius apollo]|uniref:(apollo) hypothetical protein n=1 Tax=Parnassius apollo TaxID=110799 RepID=A0A8S3W5X0_PARAO|nr:unnamed protein product [Parnassius apollo]